MTCRKMNYERLYEVIERLRSALFTKPGLLKNNNAAFQSFIDEKHNNKEASPETI